MKTFTPQTSFIACLFIVLLFGCDHAAEIKPDLQKQNAHRLDIGIDLLMESADMVVDVSQRSHGYIATAKGGGTIPAGEYAGQHFKITMTGTYSDIGLETLTEGSATVKIRDERFDSVMDPGLVSFCCGEGHLWLIDGVYEFVMYGQVNHITASEPHHHLFAGYASTTGTMNMNIADQTGTIVDPILPHDPGIGLIEGFDAQRVEVELH